MEWTPESFMWATIYDGENKKNTMYVHFCKLTAPDDCAPTMDATEFLDF